GSIVSSNRRFAEMWGIPRAVMATGSDEAVLASLAALVEDAEGFRRRVAYLHARPEEEGREDIRLKDGRVFHRHAASVVAPGSAPLGRVWFFHDVTEERRHDQDRDALLETAQVARTDAEAASVELHRLQALTDVMLRHVGLDELLNGLLDALREVLGTDTATILLVTADGKNLAVRAVSGAPEEVRGATR